MATQTTNLKLSKAEQSDAILSTLRANNNNFDTLDAKITEIENDIDNMELPIASSTTLGGIKVGENLSITADGKLSADAQKVDLSNYYTKDEVGDIVADIDIPEVSLSALGLTATATELNYVDGVTSNIQTQLDGKVAKVSGKGLSTNDYTTDEKNKLSGLKNYTLPTASSSTLGGIKVGTGLTIDGDGKLSATGVEVDLSNYYTKSEVDSEIAENKTTLSALGITATATELNYVDGVTSNVQTQLNGKLGTSGSGANLTSLNASNVSSGTLSSDRLPTVPITKGGTGATTAAAALTNLGITATATELNYVDGVTSNIQTQLNGKLATNGSGASLTSLNASNISSGTINSARLPSIAASKISAGTLAGQVLANATAVTTLGTAQTRNIKASTTDLTAGTSSLTTGDIYLVYE